MIRIRGVGSAVWCSMWHLSSRPEIEPEALAMEAQILNHWTTRDVPLVRICVPKTSLPLSPSPGSLILQFRLYVPSPEYLL